MTQEAKFISFGSGSSGNCYYLGYGGEAILIDAGIPVKQIKQGLKDASLDFAKVMAALPGLIAFRPKWLYESREAKKRGR